MQTLKQSLKNIPPEKWVEMDSEELFAISGEELVDLQLHWFKERFNSLLPRISAAKNLRDKQGVTDVDEINDITPLLFTHRVYKSYPMSYINKKKFKALTLWLDKLTTVDLKNVDVKGIKTIDEWMERMDEAGMDMTHSTGTTGKLSFSPKSQVELPLGLSGSYQWIKAVTGQDIRGEQFEFFFPGYRGGFQGTMKGMLRFGQAIANGGETYHTLYDYPSSADFMSLAGKLGHAMKTGNLKKLDIIKALVKTKGELIKMKKDRPIAMKAFIDNMIENYRGKRVYVLGTVPDLLRPAIEGLERGEKNIFHPGSIFLTGGGLKGYDAPENWPEILKEFYGNDFQLLYGMTDSGFCAPRCKSGYYHFYPMLIPFVLDVETGKPLPREGVHTGRFGCFDLTAQTMWGGLLTGDRVTIHYDECECGWKSPRVEDNIQRFSELQEDGEDKISCSGQQEAYNDFLDFVAENSEN
jgi:hypothetical protein